MAFAAVAACATTHEPVGTSHPLPPAVSGAVSRAVPPPSVAAPADVAPPPLEPVLVVSDPAALGALERGGMSFGELVAGGSGTSTKDFTGSRAYRVLFDAVAADLAADRRADSSAGVGMRFAHRQFDLRWLDSEKTRFDLIAVVNRVDRRPFAPEHCGEVRFVYRLAYRVGTPMGSVDSRLPMTVNVVYFVPAGAGRSCIEAASRWMAPKFENPETEAAWLASERGPLCAACRAAWTPKSVELNFQSIRWPSTVRPDMAGHAEYVLRVFKRLGNEPFLAPGPLENTVDDGRIERDRRLRKDLVEWLHAPEALAAVDAGTAVVPERFLATRAVSVTPHGLARRANRPFRAVMEPAEFHDVDLSAYETIRTPAALVRRLDALSCPGCHQSRSIAGFHVLGVEPEADRVDAVQVPMSPHFHAELERRRTYVAAVAHGEVPDERRPSAERGANESGIGAHCGLGDPGFARWTCASGLRCEGVSDDEVGECIRAEAPSVGDPCEHGPVSASENPKRDRVRLEAKVGCAGDRVCEANSVGFPGGMCAGSCEALPEGARCGGIPLLTEFNVCLARGTSFERCIADNTRPGALRSCGFHEPCRDDYVCARSGRDDSGVCMPPYFLFQLRVDGHPI